MTQFSLEWINSQNAKRLPKQSPTHTPYDGEESDVHEKIIEHCKLKGWAFRRDRMDKRTTGQLGWPDFSIACREGKMVFVECKRKGSKLTPEQAATLHWLCSLGHVAIAVWSYEDFEQTVRGMK